MLPLSAERYPSRRLAKSVWIVYWRKATGVFARYGYSRGVADLRIHQVRAGARNPFFRLA